MAGKGTRGWDAQSHEDLLLSFMDEIQPNKTIITNVTEKMKAKGYTYSFDAINQHVQRLRKQRDTASLQNSAAGVPTNGAATPKKAAAPRKRATPAKKAAKVIKADEDDQDDILNLKREYVDDEDTTMTPAPEAKRRKTPKLEPDFEAAVGEV
ncbi:Fc.00g014920.m01.CDS01 [Cosmosporella sp. VM-42]